MKKSEVNKIISTLNPVERGIAAAALLLAGIEKDCERREKINAQKVERFWRLFDEQALEVLVANNNSMSLLKFESQMKARRFKTPKIDELKAHGYTIIFDGFFKISL